MQEMSSTTVTADGIVMPEFDALIEAIRNAYTAYHPRRGEHLRGEQEAAAGSAGKHQR